MRRPSILDVVQAVTAVAPSHPKVRAWWYAPPTRFHLRGARSDDSAHRIEVVIEPRAPGRPDPDSIAADLSVQLGGTPASVREHRGAGEERRLFRVLQQRLDETAEGGTGAQPPTALRAGIRSEASPDIRVDKGVGER